MKLRTRFTGKAKATPPTPNQEPPKPTCSFDESVSPAARNLALAHRLAQLIDQGLVADYTAALRSDLVLGDEAHTLALSRVCARLHDAGAPRWYGVLDEMVPRLERILARHPRLALTPSDRAPLRAWLDDVHPQVAEGSDRMLDELRERITR